MIYHEWGFKSSPFQTSSLPANELGQALLVGRDDALKALIRRISSAPKMATVEGLNGVGKTSVVNVASFRLFQEHLSTGKGSLFIPCRKIFQLNPNKEIQEFVDEILMEVAQTLIERKDDLPGDLNSSSGVERWLNSPQLVSYQAGAWVIQGGFQQETNTGAGFERSGFRKAVLTWLENIFPDQEGGGVVCTIDNLELLQSSDAARHMLEQLRDELLTIKGIRWILCGSLGIVYGVVSSPRLEGYMHRPIEIGELGFEAAPEILDSRLSSYSIEKGKSYLPITRGDFVRIHSILQGNLRSVLSYVDDYCQWSSDRDLPQTEEEKTTNFENWLSSNASSAYEAARKELRPKAMEVFNKACELRVFSPGDYDAFGLNSIPAFRPYIKDLEAVGLLVSTQDDSDKRRKTIQVTPKGWMVNFHLAAVRQVGAE